MQIAGTKCATCQTKIVSESTGRRCESCSAAFHLRCIPEASHDRCPACGRNVGARADGRIVAESCVVCGLSNPERTGTCSVCKSPTAWDGGAQLADFQMQLRRSITPLNAKGMRSASFGVLIASAIVAQMVKGRDVRWTWASCGLGIALVMMVRGVRTVIRTRGIRRRVGGALDWWNEEARPRS